MSHEPDDLDLAKTVRADGQVVLAGRYRVVRELGRGGMGVVYLVEDQKLENRPTAIKMLPAVLAKNPRAITALKKEALLAMQLSHSHIVTLRGFEECDEGAFLVMDYVDGRTLEQILAEKEKLDEAEVVRIFAPIADALDYAHRKKVVHRDIKPSNIIIAADGTPYIMDFGIAREMKDTFTRTTGKGTSGTLPYMSPEQLRGQAPTPEQDTYSLAATIYECLTGHPPFWRGDIRYQIVHEQPGPLDPAMAFASVISLGLSKVSAERPVTCLAIIEAAVPDSTVTAEIPPETISLNLGGGVAIKFALIPAGQFLMGSPAAEEGRTPDEGPQHRVTISKPFFMGVYEVTQEQYEAVMGVNPSSLVGPSNPVENINWDDALEFCRKASEKTGRRFSLPTEAQWEYACRAGSKARFFFGDDDRVMKEYAWFNDNSSNSTHQVGQKKPNAWGLFDMHGNVWEWCADWYDAKWYSTGHGAAANGPANGRFRVIRGGSWYYFPTYCRSSNRGHFLPASRNGNIGFRVAVDVK